ncbi:MAG: hypothetical protein OJF49_000398 [Ktedonobacterales bacterium]|nr:MAG: hypothetical protein OJF49_000398 [Ktedonobacterales bacterium]
MAIDGDDGAVRQSPGSARGCAQQWGSAHAAAHLTPYAHRFMNSE